MRKHLTSRSNWNLEVLVFMEGGKPEKPGQKPSKQGREPTTNSAHMPTTGTEPESQRWEASALTTTPTLLPFVLTTKERELVITSGFLFLFRWSFGVVMWEIESGGKNQSIIGTLTGSITSKSK